MSPINGFIIVSILLTLGYFGSLISFLTDHETGKCEMTYMFEYPQFVRIPNTIDDVFPKYGLYAYSEGRLTERARNMQFDGIPILFIPGSGGSHKQVRSLASIALRKALNSRTIYHFDYFTIDLNHELSGLNGAILEDQLAYAKHSIGTILKLYEKQKRAANSVVVIGHSMGGIIAKALLADLPEDSDQIPLIITLSAPLVRPVVASDYFLHNFYQKYGENLTIPQATTFVSITGGYNDFLVPAYLTGQGHLSLVSTCVPKSWVSTDHLSILWCKQLVLAINRALFESVDTQSRQISNVHDHRLAVFKHHLIRHSGTKSQQRDRYIYPVSINNEGDWFESISRQYSVRLPQGTRVAKWYMIPLIIQPKHEAITVVALNMKALDWVYICPAISMKGTQRVCDVGRHLSHLTEISPSVNYKRRTLRLDMRDAKNNYSTATHVVVKVAKTDEPVVLHIDMHSPRERTLVLSDLPKWFTYRKHTLLEKSEEKTIQYQLALPHLSQLFQSYLLYVEPSECTGHTSHATISLVVPWDNHDLHGFVTETERNPINLRLHSPRPHHMANQSAVVRLTLDPTCRYRISIKNIVQFGNIARFYSPLLVANIAAVLLMTLRSQLMNIEEKERCSMFFMAIKQGAKPYYIVTAVKVLSKMLSFTGADFIFPTNDWQVLNNENLDFLVLPLILYLVSVGIVWLLALVVSISLIFFESTVHKLALKFISKTFSGTASWTNHLMKIFEKLPGAVAMFLVVTSVYTSGGLALCLATGFYFLKLTQMAQDFIEDLVKGVVKSIAKQIRDKVMDKISAKWRKMWAAQKYRFWSKNTPQIENSNKPVQSVENIISQPSNESDKLIDPKSKLEVQVSDDGDSREKIPESELDNEEQQDSVSVEKPMEIELCAGGDPGKVKKVNGDLLLRMLLEQGGRLSTNSDCSNVTNISSDNEDNTDKNEAGPTLRNIIFNLLREVMENNEIFFHFTIFMLYLIVASLNIPSVLTWAHNYRYSKRLDPDPALIPGIILSACALPLWQFEFPKVEKKHYLEISHIVYASAVICLMYGLLSIYRLSFIISGVVVLVTLHQVFAVNKPREEAAAADDPEDTYRTKVKAKWE